MPASKLTTEQIEAVRAANFANIVRKVTAGKVLTAREQRIFDESTGANDSPGQWVSSDHKLSQIFGPHRASFPRFRRQHPDAPKPRPNGDHNVNAWRTFFAAHPDLLGKAEQKKAISSGEVREAIEAEKLRERKFKNDQREGKYLPKEATLAALRDLAELLKANLRTALEDELPPLLQNQPAPIIRTHMKELVDRLCREFQEVFH